MNSCMLEIKEMVAINFRVAVSKDMVYHPGKTRKFLNASNVPPSTLLQKYTKNAFFSLRTYRGIFEISV